MNARWNGSGFCLGPAPRGHSVTNSQLDFPHFRWCGMASGEPGRCPLPDFGAPRRGAITLWVEVPLGQWSVWPGSWQAAWVGNCLRRSPATKAALGGRATRRAVTCVKPEQASKGKLWTPTRPENGEGSTIRGSSRQMHLDRSTGVVGTARRDRGLRKRGRPVARQLIAVGTRITARPPHRTVRAAFPHTAPTLGV